MHRFTRTGTASLLLALASHAAAAPEDDIRYRKSVMTALAGHAGAIQLIFTGKVAHQDALLGHAEALASAGAELSALFPPGSGTGKTDALPLIWEDAAGFRKAAEAGRDATAALREAVKSGDKAAIAKALKPAFDSCKGCHDRYRKEE